MIPDSNYSQYCSPSCLISSEFIEGNSGVSLNVVTFTPAGKISLPPVVLLPGLASVIDNFRDTLIALTEKHIVYFLETREKGSSIISGKVGFTIEDIASDIPMVIKKIGLASQSYILAGYSLGASVIAASFGAITQKPKNVVLIEPSATFKWPWWLLVLARFAVPVYGIIKPFLKWYMKTFRINTKEDYEMYEINARILDRADPKKLAATVIAVRKFEVWDYLPSIDVPCLVIGVSHDKFHSHDEASEVATRIKNSCYIDVQNNKRSHSAEVAEIIDNFIANLV